MYGVTVYFAVPLSTYLALRCIRQRTRILHQATSRRAVANQSFRSGKFRERGMESTMPCRKCSKQGKIRETSAGPALRERSKNFP